jgi:hypothetical protein
METSVKLTGKQVVRVLKGLAEGESILVGSDEWTALGDLEFEKTSDYGEGEAVIVPARRLADELEGHAEYEVRR